MRHVVDTKIVRNVAELIDALRSMSVVEPETIYTEDKDGNHALAVHLVEQTLTDGSIAYNVIIRASALAGSR